MGGGGGAAEGAWLDEGRKELVVGRLSIDTEPAAKPDGFREAGGGIGGFLPMGGGGFGLFCAVSGNECELVGRRLFFNAATEGGNPGAAPGGRGGGAAPGLGGGWPLDFGMVGAFAAGGLFLEFVSGSESYMFTPPPLLFSFGIPPAKSPPS